MEQRFIRVIVEGGETREFPDNEKGNKECLRYLTALKKQHEMHPFFATAPWADLASTKKCCDGYIHGSGANQMKEARLRLADAVEKQGLIRPSLHIRFETYSKAVDAPVKKPAAKRPSLLSAALVKAVPAPELDKLLEKLAEPGMAKVAMDAMELYEMLY